MDIKVQKLRRRQLFLFAALPYVCEQLEEDEPLCTRTLMAVMLFNILRIGALIGASQ